MKPFRSLLRVIALTFLATLLAALPGNNCAAADDLPKTLMSTRGKLLASEGFAKPLAPFAGKPAGFASGFSGWRYNAGPTAGKSGRWELADGTFTGIESPEAHHPATASFGIRYKDAIIQCDVRLDDVPAEGRQYRSFFVKATDTKDYVCALSGSTGGMNALAYDDTHADPKSGQRAKFPPLSVPGPIKPGAWHTVLLEIKGDEIVATLDGKSATLSSPLIGTDKHSVMLGVATQASFRNFRMWEALPNSEWPENKQALAATMTATPVSGKATKPSLVYAFRTEKLTELEATMNKPFTNSLGMKFVPVPGTRTLMCIHETRRADYARFAAETPDADAAWKDGKLGSHSASAGDDHPVVNVSWDDAAAFCEWLSKKEGRTYRLPTDREWSIAVGIGDQEPAAGHTPENLSGKVPGVYPWGRQWPPGKGAGNYADAECRTQFPNEKIVAGYADGLAITSPAMSFPPNELGIHDLGGNVWEWCEDWFNADRKDHVLRGASWGSNAPIPLLSSFRGHQPSTRRWRCDGFRCVLAGTP